MYLRFDFFFNIFKILNSSVFKFEKIKVGRGVELSDDVDGNTVSNDLLFLLIVHGNGLIRVNC